MKSVVTFSAAVATLAFSLPSVAQQANNPQSPMTSAYPSVWSDGTKGWMSANSGQLSAIISAVAFSFIVQDPSGIIARSSARSRSASRRM